MTKPLLIFSSIIKYHMKIFSVSSLYVCLFFFFLEGFIKMLTSCAAFTLNEIKHNILSYLIFQALVKGFAEKYPHSNLIMRCTPIIKIKTQVDAAVITRPHVLKF